MTELRYASGAVPAMLLALAACSPRPPPKPAAVAPVAQAPARPLPPPQSGTASYYGPEFAGRPTASGEPHDPQNLTAASRTLPLGAVARVTNKETGKTVRVEVNDRGPYTGRRILDLSRRAAARLGMLREGTAPVKVQPTRVPTGRGGQEAADG